MLEGTRVGKTKERVGDQIAVFGLPVGDYPVVAHDRSKVIRVVHPTLAVLERKVDAKSFSGRQNKAKRPDGLLRVGVSGEADADGQIRRLVGGSSRRAIRNDAIPNRR